MKTSNRKSHVIAIALGLTCMAGSVYAAPHNSLADSDFNTNALVTEMEPERHIVPKKKSIDLQAERPEPAKVEATARINSIRYQCNELDVAPLVAELEKDRTHKRWNYNDMQLFAMNVTQLLRDKGYFMAVAYIPPQDFVKKELLVNVIIGRYGTVNITNESRMIDERGAGLTKAISSGNVIKKQSMERVLTTMNDIPGMILKADMAPGKKPGTADISLDIKDLEKQGGYVYIDNYGSKSTGRWRLGANYHYNNISRVGDQLEVNYMAGFKNDDGWKRKLNNYMVRYNAPYKNAGTMVRTSFSRMNYDVGARYGVPNLSGTAESYEFGVSHPMHRTADHSHWWDVGYTYRNLTDDYTEYGLDEAKKRVHDFKLELHGFTRNEKGATSYSVSTDFGNMNYRKSWMMEGFPNRYNTDGGFVKTNGSVYHVQQLDKRWQLHASVHGQYAWDNLDSSADFYIGGQSGVRAFPQGEDGGNHGLLGTLEFRYRTGQPEISLAAFVDAGRIWYTRDKADLSPAFKDVDISDNVRNLAGFGLGIHYVKSRQWMAKLEWATPIGNHHSNVNGENVHNTWWFRLIRQF